MKDLEQLKEKMLALREGNLDVEAPNPRVVKCWERLNCSRTDCPAYGRLRCWSIAGTFCRGRVRGNFAQKLGDCRKCVVYLESCGDEHGELVEIFNQMLKDLKHSLRERERCSQEQARNERLAELGDLVAAVAHETRNPLQVIGLATAYLKKNFQGGPGAEFLTVIEEEVKRLSELTSLFLSFSHPEPLQLERCHLNVLIAGVADSYRRKATARNLSLALQLDDRIPSTTSDPSRVQAALSHLLDNALAASPEGGEIHLASRLEEGFVRISVQNEGVGIAPGEQKKIFRPFYTTKTRGPGLGLAIASRSVADLKGRLEVESALGQGATFAILLPLEAK